MDTNSARRIEWTAEANSDVRLDALVAQRADISRTRAATLIATGSVTVNGQRQKAAYKTEASDHIVVDIPVVERRTVAAESIPLDVVFEDEELLVVDKPAGMVVHPAPGHWEGTLVNALLGRGNPLSVVGGEARAGLVHRLDKETSGLLVVAKTERAHRILGTALSERRIVRRYAAMCWGHLDSDVITVDKPLARHPRDRQKVAVVEGGRSAKTTFRRMGRFGLGDLLRAHLHTGRTHQIRVHLASIGHPVMGDDTYGGGGARKVVKLPLHRHFLHAAWLTFRHPTSGSIIELRSPLPADLREALTAVAGDPAIGNEADPLTALGFYELQSSEG